MKANFVKEANLKSYNNSVTAYKTSKQARGNQLYVYRFVRHWNKEIAKIKNHPNIALAYITGAMQVAKPLLKIIQVLKDSAIPTALISMHVLKSKSMLS